MANETTFQPGDVVQLKSGGAFMTVHRVEGTNIHVYYADNNSNPFQRPGPLPSVILKKVDAPSEPYKGTLPPG